jgi:hypothetical protein
VATALSIIRDAYLELGVIQPGATLSPDLAQLGLLRLQNQIDAWAADRLTIAVTTRVTYTLTAGTNTVTIGTGGDIDTPRPTWFIAVNYINPGSNPPVEVPMGEMDDDSYATLTIKTLTSSLPTQFYYNATTPLGTLFFWPTVTQDVDLALYVTAPVGIPATLQSALIGPPGYQEGFMYQLAKRLAGPIGVPVSDRLIAMATEAYATLTRANNQPGLLGVDSALVPSYGGAYNVLSDGFSGSSGR